MEYYRIPHYGSLSGHHDIGITDARTAVIERIKGFSAYVTTVLQATLTVRNFSEDTVYKFRINSVIHTGDVGCTRNGINITSTLRIAPYSVVTVVTPTFSLNEIDDPPSRWLTSSICFHTSVPDDEADSDHSNDYYCTSINTELRKVLPPTVEIYPNPATKTVTLNTEHHVTSITLSDLTGKSVPINYTSIENNHLINLSGIETGVYLATVRTSAGITISKILISGTE